MTPVCRLAALLALSLLLAVGCQASGAATLDDAALCSRDVPRDWATGSVLAVVTVWYPEDAGPLLDVAELPSGVERKLRSYLGQS